MPRGLLGDLGRVEYNGYRFNNTTRTLSVRVRPVADSAGRTTMLNEWVVSLQTWITATSTTDPEVRNAVERLSHRGRPLVIQGRGLGNPDVNTGAVKDLKWGPEPGEIGLHVVGAGNAVRLTWSVTFRVPNCAGARYDFAALEFNYAVEHLVDDAGFVTRTLRGHIAVPITYMGNGSRQLSDSADEYRLSITPPLLRRFRRTFGPWVMSEDRTRLDFSITDTELVNEPLPPGVVEVRASETFASGTAGLKVYTWTLNASYRMRRGGTGLLAAGHFFDLASKRLKMVQINVGGLSGTKGNPIPAFQPIPMAFSMTNPDHYGKPAADFSISFSFTHQLPTILNASGLWAKLSDPANPVPGMRVDTWEAWAASLGNDAFHPYGGSRLRWATAAERITDLCDGVATLKGNADADVLQQTVELRRGNYFPPPAGPTQDRVFEMVRETFKKPDADASWMDYQNELWVEVDNGVVVARLLPGEPLKRVDDVLGGAADMAGKAVDLAGRAWDAVKPFAGLLPQIAGELLPPAGPGIPGGRLEAGDRPGTVRRVRASCFVYLRGYAVRAGYAIDPPRLLDIDGIEAVPANRLDRGEGFGKGVVGNGLTPLHYCRWNLRYFMSRLPDKPLPTPPNPMQGGS